MGAMNRSCGRCAASQRAVGGEVLRQPRYFAPPAARQQGDDLGVCIQVQGPARAGAIDFHRYGVGERVPDKFRVHAVLIVEALLEGQQAQYQVHGLVNAARAALPPRPDLRADVLHRRDAGGVQVARQAQIEFRRVDADEHVRFRRQE